MSSTRQKPRILMVGALPPPAIGPYLAMKRLLASRELNFQFDITFLDISDRRSIRSMGRLDFVNVWLALRHAATCWFLLISRRLEVVYLGVSQGTCGYLRDLTFLIPSIVLGKKIVLHLRGSEFGEFYRSMPGWMKGVTRWLSANTTRVIVLGECLRSVFEGLIPPDRVSVIHNGINCADFSSDRHSEPPNADAPPQILYLAHLSRRKGIFLVLEAFARVLEWHPDARLMVAGQWQADEDKAAALAQIQHLGIGGQIEFMGEVTGKRKVEVFLKPQVFLFTPVAPEGLPWVILEAMSAHLPVVTTDQGAIREVVVHGVTGRIVVPTPELVAEAVLWMLDNPAEARAMGDAGYDRVRSEFSERRYCDKLVAVFREVCGLDGSPRRQALHKAGTELPSGRVQEPGLIAEVTNE